MFCTMEHILVFTFYVILTVPNFMAFPWRDHDLSYMHACAMKQVSPFMVFSWIVDARHESCQVLLHFQSFFMAN